MKSLLLSGRVVVQNPQQYRKEKAAVITTDFFRKQQEAGRIVERVNSFFDDFQIGILLNKAGIKKLRSATPRTVLTAIFLLPFISANFYRGIVHNDALGFKKDAAYQSVEKLVFVPKYRG